MARSGCHHPPLRLSPHLNCSTVASLTYRPCGPLVACRMSTCRKISALPSCPTRPSAYSSGIQQTTRVGDSRTRRHTRRLSLTALSFRNLSSPSISLGCLEWIGLSIPFHLLEPHPLPHARLPPSHSRSQRSLLMPWHRLSRRLCLTLQLAQ